MNNQIENALLDLKDLLGKGQFLEAMEKYLIDDVVLQEANGTPKVGKDVCIAAEVELLATVTEFIRYDILHYAISGDTSYYEAIMEFKTNDGQHHRFEQVNRTKWKDGKITAERYFHA
ncbi:nuclear transport factor 2 family protein [Kordia sp. YSTF-M3]|uniref:Nuclear transport factor 2 family protein n=1 Tax=Kordia aestuariivivens TaxID=2759037 RepID=A0ABR7Q7E2_9FLAO|nr:nuclear transport factor 2 family protein [Kordia aestuariivivens]MBC8754408.1 nuclear transport factor 2 family protein [Kordia aestuariivivens]